MNHTGSEDTKREVSMSETQQALDLVEMSIEQAQGLIERKESFDRLIKNPDYQFLIEKEYFLHESSRIVLIKADPSMQGEDQQKQLEGRMTGIGYLRQYLMCINQQGSQAMIDMAAHQGTREELLVENVE